MCILCGQIGVTHESISVEELAAAAVASSSKDVASTDEIIDRLQDSEGSWVPGQVIGYSFLTTKPSTSTGIEYNGFNSFTEAQKATARLALSLWSDVANLTFVENASTSERQGVITFANSSTIDDGVWGFAYTSGETRPLWVHFDGSQDSWEGQTYGSYDLMALLHEVGHTLGLVHPSDYDAGDDGTITYAADAEFYQDSEQYTIMSYFSPENTGGDWGWNYASTPMVYDVLAVQDLYGRNYSTRSGDTVYGFNSTAGQQAFNFIINTEPVVTIWDGGGNDTLNLSGFTDGMEIDLRPGSYSSVAGLISNLAIAFGTFIDDLVAGSSADKVRDNAQDNYIIAGGGNDLIVLASGGNDTVDGGTGTDTLSLLGHASDYTVTTNSDGTLSIKGPVGSLLVSNVESFTFSGGETLTRDQMAALDFNGLLYIASNTDLIVAFGADAASGESHWLNNGQWESRSLDSFDPLEYLASNKDLIAAFGLDATAATQHYITYGYAEGRSTDSFDALAYIASDSERMDTIGNSVTGGLLDYILYGATEGATITFSGLDYIASYADLRAAFGMNAAAGVQHYLSFGYQEYRHVTFDVLTYLASNTDLIQAFGADTYSGYMHYFTLGAYENRTTDLFNAYDYAAGNLDLIQAFGYDTEALTKHYLTFGYLEGRSTTSFDVVAYAMAYNISGDGWQEAATRAYIDGGRSGGTPFGTDQTDHSLDIGTSITDILSGNADSDWFVFEGDAYTSYTITLEILNVSGPGGNLATLSVRGQDNVTVTEYAGRASISIDIYTQEAETVYLDLVSFSAQARTYRLTVTEGDGTASAIADATSASVETETATAAAIAVEETVVETTDEVLDAVVADSVAYIGQVSSLNNDLYLYAF